MLTWRGWVRVVNAVRLWLRHEVRGSERRAVLVPEDAARLVRGGVEVVVEDSAQRVFGIEEYVAAGCAVAEPGSWVDAPGDFVVVGVKELPEEPAALRHRHVFFGHAYKGQAGAGALLRRFAKGGGALLDLEYLTDEAGRRLVAFGYWAGYVGAALAVLCKTGDLPVPLVPSTKEELDRALGDTGGSAGTALVIGALGRCGRGAVAALTEAGIEPTRWDLAETRELDRAALLDHDLLVNAVLTEHPAPPFLTPADLTGPRRLSVLADVTCDVGSPNHLLPVYDRNTTWTEPVLALDVAPPLEIISIDNLPALLPREASVGFSADLHPLLAALPDGHPAWRRCLDRFHAALAELDRDDKERTHA
ncbi:MAG TPA: saccharopine dehydrogenase [Actinophytocola sp.]|uniref:saccharopine dehydrogenase n=1 Tax=Actinophytocola sp. TaxID=1872138 RepID=UPI002DC0638B|nr:saccharopine dehydrogenase [Actinophytocola sp.]HEU5474273.1 saccharopine dehydrogenase [Actinophytocola sp.]